ncbi:MAG TPA: 5-methyltetrahydropteroyltriglutamate--homocysteine S-methyltransferase [Bryobacteraceae bacterium]|jgi:5-methyltetrahydropteroyltriglutamate--homocysteine methyltransferase|nr:5-methyltetrahydropteroyltriglutamate--homocysteine S-methyltransferase [Bryobacteraceae bacterium]
MAFQYRADHVGSLLRPREVLDARSNPGVSPVELKEIEDRHITRVLQRQKDLGLKIFTDGELRRRGFMSDFYESVDGLDNADDIARTWKGAATGVATSAVNVLHGIVTRKIHQKKRLTSHELGFLKQHSPGDVKMTLPTANQFPAIMYKNGVSERAYPTRSEFLWDIVPIVKSEIQALANEGVKYIQVDAPRYSYYIDPKWRAYVKDEMGVDPEQALDEAIRADNASLEGAKRDGVTLAIHLCRGNNRSHWYAEGGYDPIAEKLFNQLNVDVFLLEYESERAGTFEPLRFVPKNKVVVLGLVSSKLPELEPQNQLIRRIEEASRYIPLENLALSPQCGFASAMEGNLLSEEEQWRKLQLVVETARAVWKDA